MQGPFYRLALPHIFPDEFSALLARRILKWFLVPLGVEDPEPFASFPSLLRPLLRELPPAWNMAILKTYLGLWTTEARTCTDPGRCIFGCCGAPDDFRHYLKCMAFQYTVSFALNCPLPSSPLVSFGLPSPDPSSCRRVVLSFHVYRIGKQLAHPIQPEGARELARAARSAADLPMGKFWKSRGVRALGPDVQSGS